MEAKKHEARTSRPTWDEYWMNIVEQVGKRSTCLRRNIGAVIVKDNIIVSTGFNGAPRGLPHCLEIGCLRDELKIPSGTRHEVCRGVHAEQNAIIRGDPLRMDGATMYVNAKPCKICAKMIANSGIAKIVYVEIYPDDEGIEILKHTKIELVPFRKK
ncbi:MAG: cytidine/deoxycytidylate deaminase family protein [Candidatus Aenigmarchaeota archaeon]|nr:cytidine/deoxycytidylate deaminase family protein [Candidatus Aenigmarchaeota archaeon]